MKTDKEEKRKDLEQAYRDGIEARLNGHPFTKHPYSWDVRPSYAKEMQKEWQRGWKETT